MNRQAPRITRSTPSTAESKATATAIRTESLCWRCAVHDDSADADDNDEQEEDDSDDDDHDHDDGGSLKVTLMLRGSVLQFAEACIPSSLVPPDTPAAQPTAAEVPKRTRFEAPRTCSLH